MPPLHILFLGAAWGRWATDALLEGLRAARPDAVVLDVSNSKECPAIPPAPCLAVCFGLRPPYEEWVKVFSQVGLHTIVLDNGYLGRVPYGVDPEGAEKDTFFYALNVDRILDPARTQALLYPAYLDTSRVERFRHLLRPAQEYFARAPDTYVFLGQTPDDRSHGKSAAWLAAYYTYRLTAFSYINEGGEVFFRPHPHAPEDLTRAVMENCDFAVELPSDEPLVPQLTRLAIPGRRLKVASISSNAGLEALLAGFWVQTPGVWYAAFGPVSALETAVHAQFTLPELRSGELANRLIDGLAFISDGCKP